MFVNLVLGRLKQQEHLFKISLAVNRDTHPRAKHREEVAAESSATNGTLISSPHPTPKAQGPGRSRRGSRKMIRARGHRKRGKKGKGKNDKKGQPLIVEE